MGYTVKENIIVGFSILILSTAITNISYLISNLICNSLNINKITYYSFMYMQEITINLFTLFMLIISSTFISIIYKSLSIILDI